MEEKEGQENGKKTERFGDKTKEKGLYINDIVIMYIMTIILHIYLTYSYNLW